MFWIVNKIKNCWCVRATNAGATQAKAEIFHVQYIVRIIGTTLILQITCLVQTTHQAERHRSSLSTVQKGHAAWINWPYDAWTWTDGCTYS